MFSHFFGNYLLNCRLIKPEQLRRILDLQESVHVKLGILAIDAGYMTADQVGRVNQLQAKMDKRFGEIAVEHGYLSEAQRSQLLGQQNKRHLLISQALIDQDILSFEQIEYVLSKYKQDSGLSEIEFEALKNNDVESIVAALVKMPRLGDSGIYAQYFSLFIRNLIRFIDNDIYFERAAAIEQQPFDCLVYQAAEGGGYRFFTGFEGPEQAMVTFSAWHAKTVITDVDELAIDSLGEFLNIHNGLFLTSLSNELIELELMPPEFQRDGGLQSAGALYRIPFTLSFGSFNFFIGDRTPVFSQNNYGD
jgi:hypothetical protein